MLHRQISYVELSGSYFDLYYLISKKYFLSLLLNYCSYDYPLFCSNHRNIWYSKCTIPPLLINLTACRTWCTVRITRRPPLSPSSIRLPMRGRIPARLRTNTVALRPLRDRDRLRAPSPTDRSPSSMGRRSRCLCSGRRGMCIRRRIRTCRRRCRCTRRCLRRRRNRCPSRSR